VVAAVVAVAAADCHDSALLLLLQPRIREETASGLASPAWVAVIKFCWGSGSGVGGWRGWPK
jgi:hypothetical protein